METHDGIALGVESAWPAFVAGASASLPLLPDAEAPVQGKEAAEHPVQS